MAPSAEPANEASPPVKPAAPSEDPEQPSAQNGPEEPSASPEPGVNNAPEADDKQEAQTSELEIKSRASSKASSVESGEASENEEGEAAESNEAPRAGDGKTNASAPPLPDEPVPQPQPGNDEDDGWEYHWNPNTSSYWFYNRYTQVWQQENPRLQTVTTDAPVGAPGAPPLPAGDPSGTSAVGSVANGYNPSIHGDYDPNAWYAQEARAAAEAAEAATREYQHQAALALAGGGALEPEAADEYMAGGYFNKTTGQWQRPEQGPDRHADEARSRRQMNAYFDVDAAANMHDGRSLKAERSGKKPSRAELKQFKEKRKAKKEEKRRAWLRD